jgi:hypothetical protein
MRETEADLEPRQLRVEGILALPDLRHGEHRLVECNVELWSGDDLDQGIEDPRSQRRQRGKRQLVERNWAAVFWRRAASIPTAAR